MATNNAINLSAAGLTRYDGAGNFTGVTVTQFDLLVGGASNGITSVSPGSTSGVPVISQGTGSNPVFGTALVAGGGTGLATTTPYAVLAGGTTGTGNLQQVGSLGSIGQVLTSAGAGALPIWANAAPLAWNDVVTATVGLLSNNGYVTDNATLVTYTIPASPSFGDVIKVVGGTIGVGGWTIAQNALQQIVYGTSSTTVGTGGSLSSSKQFDCVELLCIVAGTSAVWEVIDSDGNLTVV